MFPYKGLKSMADLWVKTDKPNEKEQTIMKIVLWINGFSEDHKFNIEINDNSIHIEG